MIARATIAAMLIVSPFAANAGPIVVDQDNFLVGNRVNRAQGIIYDFLSGNPNFPERPRDAAQSFTVVNSGTLVALDLPIGGGGCCPGGEPNLGGPLLIDIRQLTATGAPLEDDLSALFSIELTDLPQGDNELSIDGINIPVMSGDRFALVVRAGPPSGAYSWGLSPTYLGGDAFLRGEIGEEPDAGWNSFSPAGGGGFRFRTYVQCADENNCIDDTIRPPKPIPEPGTLALLGIGLAGMGLARKRIT